MTQRLYGLTKGTNRLMICQILIRLHYFLFRTGPSRASRPSSAETIRHFPD
jgi:hypothetical protein